MTTSIATACVKRKDKEEKGYAHTEESPGQHKMRSASLADYVQLRHEGSLYCYSCKRSQCKGSSSLTSHCSRHEGTSIDLCERVQALTHSMQGSLNALLHGVRSTRSGHARCRTGGTRTPTWSCCVLRTAAASTWAAARTRPRRC